MVQMLLVPAVILLSTIVVQLLRFILLYFQIISNRVSENQENHEPIKKKRYKVIDMNSSNLADLSTCKPTFHSSMFIVTSLFSLQSCPIQTSPYQPHPHTHNQHAPTARYRRATSRGNHVWCRCTPRLSSRSPLNRGSPRCRCLDPLSMFDILGTVVVVVVV